MSMNETEASTIEATEAFGLTIDPEFKSFLAPLTSEEFAQLEANVLAEGCRDPLVVWRGTVLDGHNRHEICKRHGLPFKTAEAKGIETREEALNWIILNQLGRRNLNPDQMSYFRGRLYNSSHAGHGGERSSGQSDHLKTSEKLAKELKVGEKTIRRDGEFAKAVDTLASNVGPSFREKVLTRDARVTRAAVVKLAQLPKEQQVEKAREIEAQVSPDKPVIKRRPRPKPPKGFIEKAAKPFPNKVVASADALPAGKYSCIYMDPPWETVPNHELAGLDLARLCHPDGALLWIWTSWKALRRGSLANLLKKWGFVWEAEVVWVKKGSPKTEILLVARSKNGNAGPVDERVNALLTGAPDETGRPPEARELVAASTSGPKVELFARRLVEGWDALKAEKAPEKELSCAESSPQPSLQPSSPAA